ncbi:hypothetical protein [Nostoc edaphicum]|nr:hypothetical protein [Nostoc edaphicum]
MRSLMEIMAQAIADINPETMLLAQSGFVPEALRYAKKAIML